MIQIQLNISILSFTLGNVRKQSPIWDKNLYVFLCIEVLESKAHTKTIVVVRIAIAVIEREHPSISSIIVIATTIEYRIARSDEIRVVQFNPYISFKIFGCF